MRHSAHPLAQAGSDVLDAVVETLKDEASDLLANLDIDWSNLGTDGDEQQGLLNVINPVLQQHNIEVYTLEDVRTLWADIEWYGRAGVGTAACGFAVEAAMARLTKGKSLKKNIRKLVRHTVGTACGVGAAVPVPDPDDNGDSTPDTTPEQTPQESGTATPDPDPDASNGDSGDETTPDPTPDAAPTQTPKEAWDDALQKHSRGEIDKNELQKAKIRYRCSLGMTSPLCQ